MDDATKQSILSAFRSILVAIGSVLTAKGYVDDVTWNLLLGAAMVIGPAAWGIWDKFHAEQKTQQREAVAVNAGVALSNQSPEPTPPVTKEEAKEVIAAFAVPPTTEGSKP